MASSYGDRLGGADVSRSHHGQTQIPTAVKRRGIRDPAPPLARDGRDLEISDRGDHHGFDRVEAVFGLVEDL